MQLIKPLEYFLEHFNKEGLIDKDIQRAKDFIGLLYRATGNSWRPGNCMYLPTDKANEVRDNNYFLSKFFGEVKDKRLSHIHFYWVSETPHGLFILDPTGVPTSEDLYKEDYDDYILPYFGLPENSSGYHRMVYDQMQDLDNLGKRDLPPGFHP